MLSFFKNVYILQLNSFQKKKELASESWFDALRLKIVAAGVQVESETHQILKLLRLSTKYSLISITVMWKN